MLNKHEGLIKGHPTVLPRIYPFSFGDSPIFAGQAAQLTCLVSEGDMPLLLYWSFNNRTDLSKIGISTTQIHRMARVLLIESTNSFHSGTYVCTAKNDAGVTNFSTTLQVNGNIRIKVDSAVLKIASSSLP
jgi:hypothetical protein